MNSYHDSWKVSTHKDVPCVQCHIPPGFQHFVVAKLNGLGQVVDDLLARTSTKPSASVSDFSCTRAGCHTLDKPNGKADAKSIYAASYAFQYPFKFDHGKHLNLEHRGIEIHCTTCHLHARGTKHFEVDTNNCVTCHLTYAVAPAPAMQLAPASQPEAAAPGGVAQTQPGGGASGGSLSRAPAAYTQPDVALTAIFPPGTTQPDWTAITGPAAARPAAGKVPPTQCTSCHNVPDKPVMYRGLEVVHAEYVSYGAACESCHRGITIPAKPVGDEQCFGCHDFGAKRIADPAENHRVHSQGKHKVECYSCHGLASHGPTAEAMRLEKIECQSCHRGEHLVQQSTYKSYGQLAHQPEAGSTVTPMFMAHVDCTGCHVLLKPVPGKEGSGAVVATATPKACDNCHQAGLGEQMIPQWQNATRQLYEAAMRQMPPSGRALSAQAEAYVRDARHLLEVVRLDGSWGVHNPKYTEKLIREARERLAAAEKLAAQPKAP